MFDTVLGLPLHPLVVHAVVVLGPLAAVMLLAYAVVPRWRYGLRIPLLLMSAAAAGSAFVAQEAGEALEHLTAEPGFDHAEKGDRAFLALVLLFVVTVVVVLLATPLPAPSRVALATVLAVLAAGAAVVAVVMAGHSGAQSVWEGRITSAAPVR